MVDNHLLGRAVYDPLNIDPQSKRPACVGYVVGVAIHIDGSFRLLVLYRGALTSWHHAAVRLTLD